MVKVAALASHSSGNCFLVKANGSSFLIDAGITCKQIVERMAHIGQDAEDIDAIFITHAHTDHVRGVDVFSRKFNTPVYATRGTYEGFSHLLKSKDNMNFIEADREVALDGVRIYPFSKSHDCADPVSYSITYDGRTASIITDVGEVCPNVIKAVAKSDILCLESNHDIDMLHTGPYPYFLKQRIAGTGGHLSNYDAALLVMNNASSNLSTIMLSHLSKVNNTPEKALETMGMIRERRDLKDVNMVLTSKEKTTRLFS